MIFFSSLADLLWRRKESEADVVLRMGQAYTSVFIGTASDDDKKIVLLDLADYSGFYRVNPPGTADLNYYEGMRAVYGRIFRFLHLSDEEVRSLESAARETALLRDAIAQEK